MQIINLKERTDLIPTVARWIHDEWGQFRSRSLEQIIQRLEESCVDDYPFTLVAIMNNQPVGTAALKIHDMDILHEYTPWLAGVYVPVIHRKKKVASYLISEVELRAKKRGFDFMYLFTTKGITIFYEKLGWFPLLELEYHGIIVTVMQKVLTEYGAR